MAASLDPYSTRVGQWMPLSWPRKSRAPIAFMRCGALSLSTGSSGWASATFDRSSGRASWVTFHGAYIALVRSVLWGRQLHKTTKRAANETAFAVRRGPSARRTGIAIVRPTPHGVVPTRTRRWHVAGWRSLYWSATKPPIEWATTDMDS